MARSFGDLSENAEYTEARNEQSRIEGKIQGLEKTLRTATIVDDDEINLEKVGIGTKVRILDTETNEEETYQIFGSMESDVANNIISNESPVGRRSWASPWEKKSLWKPPAERSSLSFWRSPRRMGTTENQGKEQEKHGTGDKE